MTSIGRSGVARSIVAGTVMAGLVLPANAYKIGGPFPSLHERMATMSAQCVVGDGTTMSETSPGRDGKPHIWTRIHCVFDTARLLAARGATPKRLSKQTPLEVAARWGDDPGRGLMKLSRAVPYLIKLQWTCDDQPLASLTIYRAGLMCSGHYGKLGFIHAMMSSDDTSPVMVGKEKTSRPHDDAQARTYAKILAWADLTYRVASGDLAPDLNICRVIRKGEGLPAGTNPYTVLAGAFDDGADCGGDAAQWSIRDFFTFACANPRSARPCGRQPDPDGTLLRWTAIGSLLHMIQDSYAQGHAFRKGADANRNAKGRMIPVIACVAPARFYFYDKANQKAGHSAADYTPDVDPTCGEAGIDDPVSAGATLLWMVRNKTDPADFTTYLKRYVFGATPPAEPSA